MVWRWQVETEPGDPWANMARDAALLTQLVDGSEKHPILRIYQWDRPSISFGRLQNEDSVEKFYPDLPHVRRPTGGRAVLHGDDLTLTVATQVECLPCTNGQRTADIYRLLLAGTVTALQQTGIPVAFGDSASARNSKGVVNCFDLAVGCDIINTRNGRKILGSAQRREGAVILQQMTMPVAILPDVPEFIACLKTAFSDQLKIEGWLTIDTSGRVW